MRTNNLPRIASMLAIMVILGLYLAPLSYSKGISEFTLTGNVIDGSSCLPIVGAKVTAPYNNNASNYTNSTGGYLLRLGYGNWTVTVSDANYTTISFNTPYVATGSYQFDTYLLKAGATAANCTAGRHAINSTVPTTATVQSTVATSTVPPTTIQQTSAKSGGVSAKDLEAGIGIIVVIIIIVAAYVMLSGKGKKGTTHAHAEHANAPESKEEKSS